MRPAPHAPAAGVGFGRLARVAAVLAAVLLAAAPWAAGAEASPKSCLWAVGGAGARVALLGSIHVLKPEAYPLPAQIEAAYQASRTVVFETDIDRLQDPRTQARMLELGTYPAGRSLFDELGVETRRRLEKKLEAGGIPPSAFAGFKPWMAALTLASLELRRLGFDPALGVDMHFHARAKADGKRIEGLESAEQQLQVFAALDASGQEDLLAETLLELERLPRMTDGLLDAWRGGDTDRLGRLLLQTIERYPVVRDRVLTARNRAWLPRIEALIAAGEEALVVVGALHLIGPESVVALLRQKGYRVDQR